MTDRLLPGISARQVETARLGTHILQRDGARAGGQPVLFIHGNVSSSLFWQRTMRDMPERYRPLAADLRGFGGSEAKAVDARRGLGDFADDICALLDTLELPAVHLVGWSMGGGVGMQLVRDAAARVSSLTLVNPVSPYGFGGSQGTDGRLNDPSGAGSGGGCANPDFVARLGDGDRGTESATSPMRVFLDTYVAAGFEPGEDADTYLDAMLSTRTGDDHYPGDAASCQAWPGVAPGTRGVLNAMSPLHQRLDDLHRAEGRPPVTWIRGAHDAIVSDASLLDLANLGALGAVDGWPGAEAAPPQPMVTQTRAVLDAYAAAGGRYTEHVIADAGHSPHIERPDEFLDVLLGGLRTDR